MNCTINSNLSSEVESMWNTDSQDYSKVLSNPMSLFSYDLGNTAKASGDWMILLPSSWPECPFGESSLLSSSSGPAYIPLDNGSWSPFKQSFVLDTQALIQSSGSLDSPGDSYLESPLSAHQIAFDISWPPGDFMPASPSAGFSPTTKHSCPGEENEEEIQENITSESTATSPSPTAPVETLRASRRTSQPPRTSTKASETTKRTKKASDAPKPPKTSKRAKYSSDTPSSPNQKLRSASLTSSAFTTSDTRSNHNLVEKQYRSRLNVQFESLLETLPKEPVGEEGEKRVSKTEVLVHANQYIQELERDMKALEEENDRLEGCIEDLKSKWIGLVGEGCIPLC